VQGEISSDFFNNVAAIAVVLMFAKIASHGLRKARGKPGTHALAALHGIAVVAALVAVTASLIATYKPTKANGLDVVAWWGVDIGCCPDHGHRHRGILGFQVEDEVAPGGR
jgi:hypothetical protein